MTIIAVDGRYAAADGMKTWGNEIRSLRIKKLSIHKNDLRGDIVLGYAGSAPMHQVVIDWYLSGADVDKLPKTFDNDTSWAILVLEYSKIFKLSSSSPYPEEFDPPMAIGAGIDMAIGMMLAGKTAPEAVEMINARCNTSGGEIQVIDLHELVRKEIAA